MTSTRLHLTIHAGPAALDAVTSAWIELCDRDPAASVFHRPEFLRTWWDEFGEGDPVAIELRDDGELAGLAHIVVRDGVLRFLGDAEITDYLGPVGIDRDAVAEGFVAAIQGLDGWHTAEFHCLAADSGWPEALVRAAKASGLGVSERQHDVCPRIALGGTYDDYLARLYGKLRHEIRRKARRLERDAGGYAIRLSSEETLEADLERFYEMHRSSTGPKGKFLHDAIASFFTRLARTFAANGWLRLSWLDGADGSSMAAVLSFAYDGTWYVYNSAYDHSRRELAPGMVLMGETIRLAVEEGCDTFDLLRGDEAYKYRFGAVDVPVMQLTVTRS